MSAGHVFVTLGDITHFECDAWMLPTDRRYSIRKSWRDSVRELTDERIERSKTDAFGKGKTRAIPIVDWPRDLPKPILTAVPFRGLQSHSDLWELAKALIEFVRVAVGATSSTARHGRAKRLFAFPAFGTEGGGGGLKKGEILAELLLYAREAARENHVDLVLVLRDPHIFALAQQIRKGSEYWRELPPELLKQAKQKAKLAQTGKLVPFMGAGVSAGSGVPTWEGLLRNLAKKVGIDGDKIDYLQSSGLSALDQATYLRHVYRANSENPNAFANAIVQAVSATRYCLIPALLASLRTEQAITLNFDQLFEIASADIGEQRIIIPTDGKPHGTGEKWLLKLHGSVSDPESIVLTRDDYLGYSANREALSAIVKANLITHHLLFVGFGLSDDHFHQIIHDVRVAISVDEKVFGTALTLHDDEFVETLWGDQLELIRINPTGNQAENARYCEIFLDALLAYATDSHSYLLDDGFESSLHVSQLELRQKILDFKATLNSTDRKDPAWPTIQRMLRELGDKDG